MKYVYIDGGARVGEAVEIILDGRPELLGCDSYMFECNPSHINTLNELKKNNHNYNFIIKEEALWCEDCYKKFYIANDIWGDVGSTLKPEKQESLNRNNPIEVKCINFSQFLREFDEDSYIIVKLDVEGAEYEILEHLINDGTIAKINELHVEFHDHLFGIDSSLLKERLRNFSIKTDFNWM